MREPDKKKVKHQHLDGMPWIGLIPAACDQFWSTRRVPEPGDIDRTQRENRTRGGGGGGGAQRRCSGESAVKPNKCHQWKSVFINVWMQNGALSSGPLINCLRRGRASPRDSSLSAGDESALSSRRRRICLSSAINYCSRDLPGGARPHKRTPSFVVRRTPKVQTSNAHCIIRPRICIGSNRILCFHLHYSLSCE